MLIRSLVMAFASAGLIFGAPVPKTWESLGQLNSGTPIKVFAHDRAEKGEFVSISNVSLTIHTRQGEQSFPRPDVVRIVSLKHSHRMRNFLIGVGVGVAISLVADLTVGAFLRNESNPASARPLIWTLPIALCGGPGAAIPSYSVIYRK